MTPAVQALHDAARVLLAGLANGTIGGDSPMIARRELLGSPEVQALSDAADAVEVPDAAV